MIPVSVLTGFLGSGKTTLLGRLLRHPAMARTAVIINEFGEIGIDHDLVETSDESVVQLTTGCLCCRVASDLAWTLADLARRRAAGTVPPFEQVVIETSGLADPAPIVHALMRGGLHGDYALGSVIATIDGVLGMSTLDEHELSRRQAAMADRVILTKLDLADAAPEALRGRLARLNANASVLALEHGAMEPDALFGANGMPARWFESGRAEVGATPGQSEGSRHPYQHGHEPHHDDGITSFCLVRAQPLRAVTLALFLEALADHCGADLLRVKGIVHIAERPGHPVVVHGVQHIFHAPQWLDRWPGEDRSTRLVFIGSRISQAWLLALLDLLEHEVADETARAERSQPLRP